MKKLITIIIIGVLFFASCGTCIQIARGTVFDSETKIPIAGVSVCKDRHHPYCSETDENGFFEVRSFAHGLFRCPSMAVVVRHPDYQRKEATIPYEPKNIMLIKRSEKTCMEKIDIVIYNDLMIGRQKALTEESKEIIAECLKILRNEKITRKELHMLIDLWMYYAPTDFITEELFFEIFKAKKRWSIKAIRERIRFTEQCVKYNFKITWGYGNNVGLSELKIMIDRLKNRHITDDSNTNEE